MKIRSSVPAVSYTHLTLPTNRGGGWGAAFLQEHKIELDKKYEKFF